MSVNYIEFLNFMVTPCIK